MECITSRARLLELLAWEPPRLAVEDTRFRPPAWLHAQSLAARLADVRAPGALGWREGRLHWNEAAAARATLRAVVREGDGQAWFAGARAEWLDLLPAGLAQALLVAADEAADYRDLRAEPASNVVEVSGETAPWGTAGRWVAGLLPAAPEAALYVAGYDLATLLRAEAAALVSLDGAGEVRLEQLAWPELVAGSLRAGDGPGAAPLVTAAEARALPVGAARAIVELADELAGLGGPALTTRFPDRPAGPALDRAGAVAAGADRPLPFADVRA